VKCKSELQIDVQNAIKWETLMPGQRRRKNIPIDILQKRFASGQITLEQYLEHKAILEKQ